MTFPSTHFALRAERAAKDAGVEIRMIPVPREISPDCNMGMEASVEAEASLKDLLEAEGVKCRFVRRGKC